jgi:phage host-nuclease inhibitor protein Gam
MQARDIKAKEEEIQLKYNSEIERLKEEIKPLRKIVNEWAEEEKKKEGFNGKFKVDPSSSCF